MKRGRGLGRGLGAFFPSSPAPAAQGQRAGILEIALDDAVPNPKQPRRHMDAGELESLAQSIRANGVLAPILVREKLGGASRYEIVVGERRWRAARMAGLQSVPAIVRQVEDGGAVELALLENLQRTDLNPIEEAAGYRQLIEEHRFTHEALGERLGKSRPAVANALRLLSLPDSVQALIRDGHLSAGHGRAIAALPPARAEKVAKEAVARGLSVREVERLAALSAAPNRRGSRLSTSAALSPELAEVENRLRFALATRVALHHGARGGAIEIHYADDEELQRIVDRICLEDSP